MNSTTTLVIGGTGKTGRRVAERLEQAGRSVRIGSRSAAVPFDWEDRASWGKALRDVHAAYVTYQPDLAVPRALETVRAFFTQAIDAGVQKLVLLSGRGEPEARDAEEALQATRADWTILRASWFNQNFSENFFLDPILAGEVALPNPWQPSRSWMPRTSPTLRRPHSRPIRIRVGSTSSPAVWGGSHVRA
jgi:uncharacterized protein YbjT (DUF2867 family)